MTSGGSKQSVKVVVINTKYVETDAVSFKDVVQRLTGKDSRVAYEPQEPVFPKSQFLLGDGINGRLKNHVVESSITSGVNYGMTPSPWMSNSSVLMRNISFKEFERLFREMPPAVEEFWTD